MSTPRKGKITGNNTTSEECVARKKERLDHEIIKLRTVQGLFEDVNKRDQITVKETTEHDVSCQDNIQEVPGNSKSDSDSNNENNFDKMDCSIIPKDKILKFLYCMWENNCNSCWLDASMSLLSHNLTLRYETDLTCSSPITNIIKHYNEAICTLNNEKFGSPQERLDKAKIFLKVAQDTSLKYLQPLLKYNEGDPESAFCSLINIIGKEEAIRVNFDVTVVKSFQCEECSWKKTTSHKKPIITLPKVATFQPDSPTVISECPNCKAQEQMTSVSYKTLPKCLIFHFEGGAGKGENLPLDFSLNGREYKVTGLITLEKADEESSVDHFVTWIREPTLNWWLECNDLNPNPLEFSSSQPQNIILEDVYIFMFEAFDDLGLIEVVRSDLSENSNLEDEINNVDIPVIDISSDDNNRCLLEKAGGLNTKDTSEQEMSANEDVGQTEELNTECVESNTVENIKEDNDQKDYLRKLDLMPTNDNLNKLSLMSEMDEELLPSMPIIITEEPQVEDKTESSFQDTHSPRIENVVYELSQKNNIEEYNQGESELNTATSEFNESPSEELFGSLSPSLSNISDTSDKIILQETIEKSTLSNPSCNKPDSIINVNEKSDKIILQETIEKSILLNPSCNKADSIINVKEKQCINDAVKPKTFDESSVQSISSKQSKPKLRKQHLTLSEIIAPKEVNTCIHDTKLISGSKVNSLFVNNCNIDDNKVTISERPPPTLEVNVKVNNIDSNDSESEELKELDQIDTKILVNDDLVTKQEFMFDIPKKTNTECKPKIVTIENESGGIAENKGLSPRLDVKLPVNVHESVQENLKTPIFQEELKATSVITPTKKLNKTNNKIKNLNKIQKNRKLEKADLVESEKVLSTCSTSVENLSSKYNLKPVSLILNKLTPEDILEYTSKESKSIVESVSEDIKPTLKYMTEDSKLNFQSLDMHYQKIYNEMQNEMQNDYESLYIDESFEVGEEIQAPTEELNLEKYLKCEKPDLPTKEYIKDNIIENDPFEIQDQAVKKKRGRKPKNVKSLIVDCSPKHVKNNSIVDDLKVPRVHRTRGRKSKNTTSVDAHLSLENNQKVPENSSSESSKEREIKGQVSSQLLSTPSDSSIVTQLGDNNISQTSDREDDNKQTIKIEIVTPQKNLENNPITRKSKRGQKSTSPDINHQTLVRSPFFNSSEYVTIKSKFNDIGTSLTLVERKTEEDKRSDCCLNPNITETISSNQTTRKSERKKRQSCFRTSADVVNISTTKSDFNDQNLLTTTKGHISDGNLGKTKRDTVNQVVHVQSANKRKRSKSSNFDELQMSPSLSKRSPPPSNNSGISRGVSSGMENISALGNKPQQNLDTIDDIIDQVVGGQCVNKRKTSNSVNFNDQKMSKSISKRSHVPSSNIGISKVVSPGIEKKPALGNEPQQILDSIDDTINQVVSVSCVNQKKRKKSINFNDSKLSPSKSKILPIPSSNSVLLKEVSPRIELKPALYNKAQKNLDTIDQVNNVACVNKRRKLSINFNDSKISPENEKIPVLDNKPQQNLVSSPNLVAKIKSPAKQHSESANNFASGKKVNSKNKQASKIPATSTKPIKKMKVIDPKMSTSTSKVSPILPCNSAKLKRISSRIKKIQVVSQQNVKTSPIHETEIKYPAKEHIESAYNLSSAEMKISLKNKHGSRLNSFTSDDLKSPTSRKMSPIPSSSSANLRKASSRIKKVQLDKNKQVDNLMTSPNPVLQVISPAKKDTESGNDLQSTEKTIDSKIKEATRFPAISTTQTSTRTTRTSLDILGQSDQLLMYTVPTTPNVHPGVMVPMYPNVNPLVTIQPNVINTDLVNKNITYVPKGECTAEKLLQDMDPIIQFIIDKTIALYRLTDPK